MSEAVIDHEPTAPVGSRVLEIPTLQHEVIPVEMDSLFEGDENENDNLREIVDILTLEKAPVQYWIKLIEEVWRLRKSSLAIELAETALRAFADNHKANAPLYSILATYYIALARKAPQRLLDDSKPRDTKEKFLSQASSYLASAKQCDPGYEPIEDVTLSLLLMQGNHTEGAKLADSVLKRNPRNFTALLVKARHFFHLKNYQKALKLYQRCLVLQPNALPDPRLGIGLCYWHLNFRSLARRAWLRSIFVHEADANAGATAHIFLALSYYNESHTAAHAGGEAARVAAYQTGLAYAEAAFRIDDTAPSTLSVLTSHLLFTEDYPRAARTAARMLEHASMRNAASDAYLYQARLAHAQGDLAAAYTAYQQSLDAAPGQLAARLALAQTLIQSEEYAAAVTAFEEIVRRSTRCIEALAALSSLHTLLSYRAETADGIAAARTRAQHYMKEAKTLLDTKADAPHAPLNAFTVGGSNTTVQHAKQVASAIAHSMRVRQVADDPEFHVEVAKVFLPAVADENPTGSVAYQAFSEATRLRTEVLGIAPAPDVLNDMGVILFQGRQPEAALEKFEGALKAALEVAGVAPATGDNSGESGDTTPPLATSHAAIDDLRLDAVVTAAQYNIALAHDALGDDTRAEAIYNAILTRHPEYTDAKARLALLFLRRGKAAGRKGSAQLDHSHSLLKECLTSQPSDPEIRALYTYFLVETNANAFARDFNRGTLHDVHKYDPYGMCVAGYLYYTEAREGRDMSARERQEKYLRAAQFFQRTLQLYPQNAFAANGLGICIAEGVLGRAGDSTRKNSFDAITLFTKVKETLSPESALINIGHCHYQLGEFERAIENYEGGLKFCSSGQRITVLTYLARAWFHKASRDQSFAAAQRALALAQQCQTLSPRDVSLAYNTAMVQQRTLEIVCNLAPERRTAADIEAAIKSGTASVASFKTLLEDAQSAPYIPKEVCHQRQRYGATLLKRATETVLETQRTFEREEQEKRDHARALRDAEQARVAQAEQERLEALAAEARAVAERRRVMNEETTRVTMQIAAENFDDDEDKKKRRRGGKKAKMVENFIVPDGSGSESGSESENGEDGNKSDSGEKSDSAEKSDSGEKGDAAEADAAKANTKKANRRKRVIEDDEEMDEDAPANSPAKKKKTFKSSEFIQDSDEE